MKKIFKILLFFFALSIIFSSCIMGGGENDKKEPNDVTEPSQKEEPKPPEPDAPDIDVNLSDTVAIH